MRFFTARSLALATLVPALLLFVFVPGCAKQNEGERCGDDFYGPDSDDCDDGLTCTNANLLLSGTDATHRCCYSNGNVSDSRCEPKGAGMVPSAGAGGGGASGGGASGGAGAANGGTNAAGESSAAGESGATGESGAAGQSSAAGGSIQSGGSGGTGG